MRVDSTDVLQVGLNATGLADEEEGLLPEGADEAAYARASKVQLAARRLFSDMKSFTRLCGMPIAPTSFLVLLARRMLGA